MGPDERRAHGSRRGRVIRLSFVWAVLCVRHHGAVGTLLLARRAGVAYRERTQPPAPQRSSESCSILKCLIHVARAQKSQISTVITNADGDVRILNTHRHTHEKR